MKNYIYSSLLILTIAILAITTGCGGGDGVIQPGAITTSPDNNNLIENSGSITVKVVWPQPGVEGKCIFSSGGKGEITASMPGDTKKILVTVRSDKDDKENIFEEYSDQWHLFEWEPGQTESAAILKPIPAVKVIVRAQAYNSTGVIIFSDPNAPIISNDPISETETEVDVILGEDNYADLNLGDYVVNLSGDSSKFVVIPDFKSPVLKNGDEINITAELNIKFPYNDTSGEEPTPIPIEGREINFQITSGNAYFDDDTTGKPKTLTAITTGDGKCQVKVKADENITPGEQVIVKAKFYALGYDPLAIPDSIDAWHINVIDPLIMEDNFEGEKVGIYYSTFFGRSNADPSRGELNDSDIDTFVQYEGAKSLRLFGLEDNNIWWDGTCNEHTRAIACRSYDNDALRVEIRAKIMNGNNTIVPSTDPTYSGYPYCRGIIGLSLGTILNYRWIEGNDELLRFEDDNKIYAGIRGQAIYWSWFQTLRPFPERKLIGSYSPGMWYSVRIQLFYPEVYGGELRIYYLIEDINGVIIVDGEDLIIPSYYRQATEYITLQAAVGHVWFDDVKLYNLTELPEK